MEWRHSSSPCPKKFRVQKSAGKVLASIFWDQDGILLIDYLPKDQTINTECYSSLLVQLQCWTFWRKNAVGRSARGSCSCMTMPGSLGTCNPEQTGLPGLPMSWSPTLFSRSGLVGLPGLKKQLKWHHFLSDVEVIAAVETWLDRQPSEFFLSGLQKLKQRAKKCIEFRGEYVE